MSTERSLRIGFVHPDLGIGGAEQLVVNFALALKNKGHDVTIYTPYHDPKHCFKETIDGTLNVEVHGGWFPNQIRNKATALCAIIRMIICSFYIVFYGGHFDVIIVDQVPTCIPILRIFGRKVLFYCHFPDKLLCVERKSAIKKVYRFFLDLIEEITTLFANLILVNSLFTREIFKKSFPLISKFGVVPDVLYPAIDFTQFENTNEDKKVLDTVITPFFLSLNRYERKKDIMLAIKAYAELKKINSNLEHKLVIAGGYDERVRENIEYLQELKDLAISLGVVIDKEVQFLRNITNSQRVTLLKEASAVLYTPQNEHFGIVPTEAMYMTTPVIACNSGGPKESVLNEKTGFLLEPDPKLWAEKMNFIANNKDKRNEMGKAGKQNVQDRFGLVAFANFANEFVKKVVFGNKKRRD